MDSPDQQHHNPPPPTPPPPPHPPPPPPPPPPANAYGFPPEAFDPSLIPDVDTDFIAPQDLDAFARALQAPDPLQSPSRTVTLDDGVSSPLAISSSAFRWGTSDLTRRKSSVDGGAAAEGEQAQSQAEAVAVAAAAAGGEMLPPPSPRGGSMFFTARHDWAPVNVKISNNSSSGGNNNKRGGGPSSWRPPWFSSPSQRRQQQQQQPEQQQHKRGSAKRKRRAGRAAAALLGERTKDETREGYLYALFQWPLLLFSFAWLGSLIVGYALTRSYIFAYEHYFTWRGRREKLRRNMRQTSNYSDWVAAARELDVYLKRQAWKEENRFAYYDAKTVKTVWEQMRRTRLRLLEREDEPDGAAEDESLSSPASGVEDLRALLEACMKHNFVGVEGARLYSQTYYGTKNLVQNFVDELEKSLRYMLETDRLGRDEKRDMFKRLNGNYGRTALCLSGGAAFAYYHFGVVRALLDADLLPDVITGTSGGAIVAALVATRTNDELRQILVPALATKINACSEGVATWLPRWWRTGARFDSLDWARRCGWWTRGSTTFREAYGRTGRILNVSCVPADPHSPSILCNYLTSPDCVIWSAVLASAAVPGILNPVVLMMKRRDGTLAPYSFGHKWKDGSLRTDIPIKALNTHFNVNFTIVSQVNPHVNLFFFSARGRVGDPVTHRKGRGWRGGFLMSALEHWIRLDMHKWLRFVRAAEILPRPLGQDWSQLWLQQFGGTVTLWPKTTASDFWRILSDPDGPRLARMMHEGRQCAFPVLKFVHNRLKVERLVERGWRATRQARTGAGPDPSPGSRIEPAASEDELRGLLLLLRDEEAAGAGTGIDTGIDTGGEEGYGSSGLVGIGSATEEDEDEDEDETDPEDGLVLKRRALTEASERMGLVESEGERIGRLGVGVGDGERGVGRFGFSLGEVGEGEWMTGRRAEARRSDGGGVEAVQRAISDGGEDVEEAQKEANGEDGLEGADKEDGLEGADNEDDLGGADKQDGPEGSQEGDGR